MQFGLCDHVMMGPLNAAYFAAQFDGIAGLGWSAISE